MKDLQTSQWGTPFHKWYKKSYNKELEMSQSEIYQELMKKDSTMLPYVEQFEKETLGG